MKKIKIILVLCLLLSLLTSVGSLLFYQDFSTQFVFTNSLIYSLSVVMVYFDVREFLVIIAIVIVFLLLNIFFVCKNKLTMMFPIIVFYMIDAVFAISIVNEFFVLGIFSFFISVVIVVFELLFAKKIKKTGDGSAS